MYLDTGRDAPLKQTVALILARPGFGEPALMKIRQALADGGKTTSAVEVAHALFAMNPQDDGHALAYARALWLDNRREEAREFLATLALAETARENICARIGGLCLDLGEKPPRARVSRARCCSGPVGGARSAGAS